MLVRTNGGTDRLQNLDIYRKIILRSILRKLCAWARIDTVNSRLVINMTVKVRAAGMYRNYLGKWWIENFTRRRVCYASYI